MANGGVKKERYFEIYYTNEKIQQTTPFACRKQNREEKSRQ